MGWRTRESDPMLYYERLPADGQCSKSKNKAAVVPKGYVPVLVGFEEEMTERFVLDVRLFKDPCIALLLEIGAQEFGYSHKGIIRIPCDAQQFRRMIVAMSKSK